MLNSDWSNILLVGIDEMEEFIEAINCILDIQQIDLYTYQKRDIG